MSPSTSIYPGLLYADAEAAMDWLEGTLGLERHEVHHDDDGNVVHAEMIFGSSIVMLSSAGIGREPFRSLPSGQAMVYVAIDDVDGLHRRATDAGAEIALELTDTDYGSRDFTVRDPEGNLWAFGTYRPSAGSRG